MAEWDAESRLEEIKRGQRKGAKAKLAIGTVFLAVGLVMSFYLIFFSGGFAGPLGVLLGFAFLVVAIVGAVLVATGYFDLKSAKVISTAPVGASSTEAQPSTQSEVSGNEPASFLGKEMKWKRGEMKDTWTVEEGGREVGRISGKGTYPFSYTVKGQFETTDFQMVIVKRPDKHWEVGTGQGAKEWARIWNASVTHLSPAVVRTFDGRVFEIRDAGRTDKGLAFVVVGKGEKVLAETIYHEPRGNEMGTFLAKELPSDAEIMTFALVCVVFAALLGPLEGAEKK